ncbi:MAG: hypothetical protein ACM3VZ_11320 [Acidobacteriota bacterium]
MSWPARIVLAIALVMAGFTLGTRLKQGQWDADKLARDEQARKVEASWSEQIQKARSTRDDEIDRINTSLADALERLRKRPDRMPEASRSTCEGATGAQLSGPDSGFLSREAARADSLRAALSECYDWIDTVKAK